MIYFIQAENEGIKIGRTILSPEHRMKDMQVGCPIELTLLGTVKGNKTQEKELHNEFKSYRLRGEWFSIEIKGEIESIINDGSPLIVRKLQAVNRAISKSRDVDNINKLVHEKEEILQMQRS